MYRPAPAAKVGIAVSSRGRERRATTPCDLGDELKSQRARAPRVAEGVARRLMPLVLNQGHNLKRNSKYVKDLRELASKMRREGTGTRTMKGADIALKALSLPLGVASRISAAFSNIACDLILMSKSPDLATASAAAVALERLAGVFEAFLELRVTVRAFRQLRYNTLQARSIVFSN